MNYINLNMKQYLHYFAFFFVLICTGFQPDATSETIGPDLYKNTPQNFTVVMQGTTNGDTPVGAYDSSKVMKQFLADYFSPWDNPERSFKVEGLKNIQQEKIKKVLENPGFGINRLPIAQSTISLISENMGLDVFPNVQKQAAIVVSGTHLRGIPTQTTSFSSMTSDGSGYPFDDWQESYLVTNEPVCVLHQSKDKQWCFVVTGGHNYGWVLRKDIAYVNPAFISMWRGAEKYITPLSENKLTIGGEGFYSSSRVRMGQLIPLAKKQDNTNKYKILTVGVNSKGDAEVKEALLDKKETVAMPLLATPNNMIRLANQLMGQAYGWGGLEGYRDCSALTKDLLMPFGIWMPRDSGPQAKSGESISLQGLDDAKKKEIILKSGKPFFSLITMPGHVVLYVGTHESTPYGYNAMWGLRIKDQPDKRAIIGKTVIMPLDWGKDYPNIETTLLTKATGLLVLTDRLVNPTKPLPLFTAQK